MSRKVRNSKSPEQRREETERIHQSLTDQVERLNSSEEWMSFLATMSRFHNYSINNLLLIQAQCPGATRVAGFRKWMDMGRSVKKGERSIKIYGFAQRKLTEEEIQQAGDSISRYRRNSQGDPVVTYFPIWSVFDVSQTQPLDPDSDDQFIDAEHFARKLEGEDHADIYRRTSEWVVSELGYSVERRSIQGEANGYTIPDTREVVVRDDLSPAQAAKTMLHEAAHVILHSEDLEGATLHRGATEVEAESVAYVVAASLELDTSSYSVGYVTGWSGGDMDLMRTTAERVLGAAHRIIDALQDEGKEEPAAA